MIYLLITGRLGWINHDWSRTCIA